MKLFLALALAATLATFGNSLTSDEYEEIRWAFFRQIRNNYAKINCPTLVRLAFHDCVGGCDGCINLDDDHNAGLSSAINIAEAVKEDIEAKGISISRADLWAILGRAGAEYGMEGMPGHEDWDSSVTAWKATVSAFVSPFGTFKYGRTDCETSPNTTAYDDLPGDTLTHDDLFAYFANEFGFNDDQTVLIMGAHTYGRMQLQHSGHSGPWLTREGRTNWDNEYYRMMINTTLRFKGLDACDGECDAIKPQFMGMIDGDFVGNLLAPDFAIAYEFSLDDSTGLIEECDISGKSRTCSEADTFSLVETYANDNDLWISSYAEAYDAMTMNGYDSLTEVA